MGRDVQRQEQQVRTDDEFQFDGSLGEILVAKTGVNGANEFELHMLQVIGGAFWNHGAELVDDRLFCLKLDLVGLSGFCVPCKNI